MKKVLIGLYILIIASVFVLLCNDYIFANKKSNKEITAGEKIYNQQLCSTCHGETGKGEGSKPGTALNNQNFLNTVSDQDISNAIKYGRDGTSMTNYGSRISEKDLKKLVAYVRNWQTKKITFEAPAVITGNAENGNKLYQLYCHTCHGDNASGMEKMGPSLVNTQYLKYTSDKQIWITIAYGRENTSMGPSLKGQNGVKQLTTENITDIVAYIRSLKP